MCNEPRGFTEQYRRFLLRVLRDNLKFGEVPIKMYLQKRRRGDKRNELGVEEDPEPVAESMEDDEIEFDEDYGEIDSELEEATDERESGAKDEGTSTQSQTGRTPRSTMY